MTDDTLAVPCRLTCKAPAGSPCVFLTGPNAGKPRGPAYGPHPARVADAALYTAGAASKQPEVDLLVTTLEAAEAAVEDAMQDAAGYAQLLDEEKTAHAETRTVAAQQIVDLREALAILDARYVDHMASEHPAPPILLGAGGGNIDRTKTDIDIDRWYGGPGDVDKAVVKAKANHAAGIRTWASFKCPFNWADMASGKGDAWATALLAKLDALGFEVWVAFHHEPEGDGNTADWRKMQDHLSRLVPGGIGGRVKFWLIVTGWHQEFGQSAANKWETLYPVGAPIYGIAYDAPYLPYGQHTDPGKGFDNGWTEGKVYVERLAARAKGYGVKAGIGEFGYSDEAFAKDKAWLDRTLASTVEQGLLGVAYFDTTLNSAKSWTLGAATSPKRAHFYAALAEVRGA